VRIQLLKKPSLPEFRDYRNQKHFRVNVAILARFIYCHIKVEIAQIDHMLLGFFEKLCAFILLSATRGTREACVKANNESAAPIIALNIGVFHVYGVY
jgi:hypothetical protein